MTDTRIHLFIERFLACCYWAEFQIILSAWFYFPFGRWVFFFSTACILDSQFQLSVVGDLDRTRWRIKIDSWVKAPIWLRCSTKWRIRLIGMRKCADAYPMLILFNRFNTFKGGNQKWCLKIPKKKREENERKIKPATTTTTLRTHVPWNKKWRRRKAKTKEQQ